MRNILVHTRGLLGRRSLIAAAVAMAAVLGVIALRPSTPTSAGVVATATATATRTATPTRTPTPTKTPRPDLWWVKQVRTTACTAGNGSVFTFTQRVNTGLNRLLVVSVQFDPGIGGTAVAGVTYDGTPLQFTAAAMQASNARVELWSLVEPRAANAALPIVVTMSGSTLGVACSSASFVNVDQAQPFGPVVTASGLSGVPSLTLASNVGDMVMDAVAVSGLMPAGSAGTSASSWWRVDNAGVDDDLSGASAWRTGAASVTSAYNNAGANEWAEIAVNVRQAPADQRTPTITPTFTITNTPTITLTPSITPTPTITLTPSITPTPSDTATPQPAAWAMSIDCNPATAGIQTSCVVGPGRISVDVILTNVRDSQRRLGAFGWNLVTNQAVLNPAVTTCDLGSGYDCNPDFDDVANTGSWACAPPAPRVDVDTSATVADSNIGCFNGVGNGQTVATGASQRLGSVIYDAQVGTATLNIRRGNLYEQSFGELGSCNTVIAVDMACYGATIDVQANGPTATPCADTDCDGVPDATDNCPFISNASQINTDGNLWKTGSGANAIQDVTNPMSDAAGNVCDDDDDNDGIIDTIDTFPIYSCGGSGYYTDSLTRDSDDDRFLDGIECSLGSDPGFQWIVPTLITCGSALDGDGDKIVDRIEICFYGTDPGEVDSDGDGVRDGCEVASLNGDLVVNVADLGIIAAASNSVPKYHVSIDVNKDGLINVADLGVASSLISPTGQCP